PSIRSSSFNELFDLNGSHIGYGEVTKIDANGGKETNKYTTLTTNPDQLNSIDYFKVYVTSFANPQITEYLDPLGNPFAPPSYNNFHQRGLLLEKSVKTPNNVEVYKLNNIYTESSHPKISTKGLKFYTLA